MFSSLFNFPDDRSARLFACDCAELVVADLGAPAAAIIAAARGFANGDVLPAGLNAKRYLARRIIADADAVVRRAGWNDHAKAVAGTYAARAVLACCRRRADEAAVHAADHSARSIAHATGEPFDYTPQSVLWAEYLGY